jgi:hypothetical protein
MRLIKLKTFYAILLGLTALVAPARGQSQRPAPVLGADLYFASTPSTVGEALQDQGRGDEMAEAFRRAGIKSLRFSSHGYYSHRGIDATEAVKIENKRENQYPWFALDRYVDFIARHDFTTVFGINVEEGPEIARDAVERFINRGLKSRLVAIELSNEPWLSHRPWQPEEYAARAASVVEHLTPLGVPFALPLTVGGDKNTPTKLSDNEWNERMLRAFASRIDLKNRDDIYGVLHLYSDGMRGKSVDYFNRAVRPFAPRMRYLVTEFNIRLTLSDNPQLTNKYALEFARKLADVMARPEIEAMYVHAVPIHSVLYWSNGRKFATVSGQGDRRLTGEAMSRGWHLTPAGKVHDLFSRLAWNGELIEYRGGGSQSYWAVGGPGNRIVVTFINDTGKQAKKRIKIAGREMNLVAPPRSIVCYDRDGREIEQLPLPY